MMKRDNDCDEDRDNEGDERDVNANQDEYPAIFDPPSSIVNLLPAGCGGAR